MLIMGCFWDCIVITCPSMASVIAVEREMEYFKRKGRIPSDATVLIVEDPAENMGSGAATLNALVIATEYLCAQHNYMVVTSDVIQDAHILILHHGRNYLYNSCGKAFITLPKEVSSSEFETVKECNASGILTSLENLLNIIAKISLNSPPGIWVCSTDMLLTSEAEFNIDWKKTKDSTLFCVFSDVKYATGHGTVSINEEGYVKDIIYCGSSKNIEQCKRHDGRVPLVAGIVFLSIQVAESLLSLHAVSPLDSCTYMGLDSGVESIQMSLFFDILVAMATEVSKEAFLSGRCGKTYNVKAGYNEERLKGIYRARSLMWEELSRYKLSAEIFEHCSHLYWTDQLPVKKHIDNLFTITSSGHIHSVTKGKQKLLPSNHLLINCIITVREECSICSGTVISNSYFELDKLYIGKNCFVSGIIECNLPRVTVVIPDDIVVLSYNIQNENKSTVAIFGIEDNPVIPINHPDSTFSNKPWKELFIAHGICEDDLWDLTVVPNARTLMNAKLYPRQSSLKDVMWLILEKTGDSQDVERWRASQRVSLSELCLSVDNRKEFVQRRDIYSTVTAEKITEILFNNEDIHLLPYFRTACAEGWQDLLITTLDSVLMSENSPLVLTRTLSCMADLLGTMAGKKGGLRSGPGGNKSWGPAFDYLMCGSLTKGMMSLKIEREKWLDRPDHLMRAARHYERAAQVLIQNAVKTARKERLGRNSVETREKPGETKESSDQKAQESINAFMTFSLKSLPQMEEWVTAECPVRIDLQGGWTDTPPICYELGGSVVNVAILVDGKKPVGARARRIKEPVLIFQMGQDDMASKIVIEDLKDLLNYDQPAAQGALLKAAVICAEIVDIKSKSSLKEQLLHMYKGGLEIQSWSILPQGCGMGTSSILAGAVMAVLWSVSGKAFENLSIVHAVLYVEQLLTTGGGWQDQIGGIMGGINRGYSDASLPIQVKVEPISVSLKLLATLNKHLILIYTGKVRLAKNLLQNVIRNWYARDETIVGCFKDLFSSSLEMEAALRKGNLVQIGALMNRYWKQKKILAPGCEPAAVKIIMEHLAPICYGQMLAGAGGGGFMCILTKQPEAMETVKSIIYNIKGNDKASVHSVTVDCSGLSVNS